MSVPVGNSVLQMLLVVLCCAFVACQPQPRPVRHLGEKQEVDTALLAHMQLSMRMSEAADRACSAAAEADSLRYALDDFGFWFAKTVTYSGDRLVVGQEVVLHLQISELNGNLIADTKSSFVVGAGDLPLAVTRSLKMMGVGEQMKIIAPWYAAYGVEGTKIIKPYTNLLIIVTVEE